MLVTDNSFLTALQDIDYQDRITIDLETTGLRPYHGDELCGVAILTEENSYYFPFRHGEGYNLPLAYLEPLFKTILNKKLTNWNSKFDLAFIRKEWLRLSYDVYPPVFEDVMLASHLLNENQQNFKLKDTGDCYATYLGYADGQASREQHKLHDYLASRKLDLGTMWKAPAEIVAPYAEQDVFLTEQLRNFFIPALQRWQLLDLWHELNDYLLVVHKMEAYGMALDMDKLHAAINSHEQDMEACLAPLRHWTGLPKFTPNSHAIFNDIINSHLNRLGLSPIYSTKEEQLEELLAVVPEDDVLTHILEASIYYRRLVKVNSTYYKNFQADQVGGILHPELNMIGTVSGRFSGSLLTIPRKNDNRLDPKGKIKQVFKARPGHLLVQADFKMAEVYLAAHFSQAKNLIAMLKEGVDIHQKTADLLGVERHVGKTLNFAANYGIGAEAFQLRLKHDTGKTITTKQAAQYLLKYRRLHPEIEQIYYDLQNQTAITKHIRTMGGRVRHLNGYDTWRNNERPAPFKDAFNNIVQGTVTDLTRIAQLKVDQVLPDFKQLLQVHDSIIGEIPEDRLDMLPVIKDIMEMASINGQPLTLPMKVDIEIGQNWGSLTKWQPK